MTEIYILYITKYGEDWEDNEHYVFFTKEEADVYKSEYLKEHFDVSSIEHINTNIEKVTENELRSILSVAEYCRLFPGLKEVLDDYINH